MTDTAPLLREVLSPLQLRIVALTLGTATDAEMAVICGTTARAIRYQREQVMAALPECLTWRQVKRLAIAQGISPELPR